MLAHRDLIAAAPGIVNIDWHTVGPDALDFFGLADAPGTSFFVLAPGFPEPGTIGLLGLGLIGMGLRARRARSSR